MVCRLCFVYFALINKDKATYMVISWRIGRTQVRFHPLTWNTRGAETILAKAEDNVAEIIPAIVIGPNTETSCITCNHEYHTWAQPTGRRARAHTHTHTQIYIHAHMTVSTATCHTTSIDFLSETCDCWRCDMWVNYVRGCATFVGARYILHGSHKRAKNNYYTRQTNRKRYYTAY
jgi:hypothetical protein